jgi:hypothetical protein
MAYNQATITQIDPADTQERVRIVVRFTGNAGEPAVTRERYVTADDTNQTLRSWARNEASRLLARKNIADSLTVGQTVNLSAPAPDAAAEAKNTWFGKLQRFKQGKAARDAGLLVPSTADMDALKADLEATYLAAYFTDF